MQASAGMEGVSGREPNYLGQHWREGWMILDSIAF